MPLPLVELITLLFCSLFRTRLAVQFARAVLILLLFVTGAGSPLYSQPSAASPVFPADRHKELMEEFDFTPPPPEEEPLPEEATDDWNWDNLNWGDWSIDFSPTVTYSILALLLLLLGVLVYRILGDISLRKRTLAEEPPARIDVNDIQEEELIAEGVSLSLLERAERAGQFDLAIRLHYIQLLKELQDANLIKYRKDFTNRDYRNQLAGQDVLPAFRTVSEEYERYWFGKYPLDRLSYRVVHQEFTLLSERVRSLALKTDDYV